MSWDVLAQDYGGRTPSNDEALDGPDPRPMGSAEEVRQRIDDHLPGVLWSDARHGVWEGGGVSIEFEIGGKGPIDHVMLSVRGSGDALGALARFAQPNRWSLFDLSESEFLDLDNPEAAGWEGFQEYRDRVVPPTSRANKPRGDARKSSVKRATKKKKE